jgi:hypothetical protein
MAPTTQQAPVVTIATIISVASCIPVASTIPEGIQHDSAILARSSANPAGSAIPIHSAIPMHSTILVHSTILEASTVPPPKSSHFTLVAPMVLTPTTPIPTPIPRQTMVSLASIEDPLRYRTTMTPPSCVPSEALITPEVERAFLHVS